MTDFEEIYVEHFNNVYKYVYSLCQNSDIAEEITQEAFYKAMEHMGQFEGKCSLYVWICQIAKNTYFTYAKKQKRYVSETNINEFDDNFEHSLLDRDMAWRIHKVLHQLKEPYKEVFSLRVFGELSFAQIGELFGKTDSWARVMFYRGKNELRRKLNGL